MSKGAVLPVVVNVANTGTVAGDEIVMVFVSFPNTHGRASAGQGAEGLRARHLAAGEEKQVTIPVRLSDLDYFQTDAPGATTGNGWSRAGPVKIMVGGSSDEPSVPTVNVIGTSPRLLIARPATNAHRTHRSLVHGSPAPRLRPL